MRINTIVPKHVLHEWIEPRRECVAIVVVWSLLSIAKNGTGGAHEKKSESAYHFSFSCKTIRGWIAVHNSSHRLTGLLIVNIDAVPIYESQ